MPIGFRPIFSQSSGTQRLRTSESAVLVVSGAVDPGRRSPKPESEVTCTCQPPQGTDDGSPGFRAAQRQSSNGGSEVLLEARFGAEVVWTTVSIVESGSARMFGVYRGSCCQGSSSDGSVELCSSATATARVIAVPCWIGLLATKVPMSSDFYCGQCDILSMVHPVVELNTLLLRFLLLPFIPRLPEWPSSFLLVSATRCPCL